MPIWSLLAGGGAAVVAAAALAPSLIRRGGEWSSFRRRIPLNATVCRYMRHPIGFGVIRTAAVIVFCLVVAVGFFGAQNAYRNAAPSVVWTVVWVGTTMLTATVGNLWALINPWEILHASAEVLYSRRRPGRRLSVGLRYPDWLGAWPALGLFAAIVWIGLIWEIGQTPAQLALAITVYSAITWAGIFTFGRETWLRSAEAVTATFALLSRMSILEQESGITEAGAGQRLYLRLPGAGLLADRPLSWPHTVIILLMLSAVIFDGLVETSVWNGAHDWIIDDRVVWPFVSALRDLGLSLGAAIKTAGFVLLAAAIIGAYLVQCQITASLGGTTTFGEVARTLALSLVPVAVAFHLAHHLPAIAEAGSQIVALAADPFGLGWTLWDVPESRHDAVGPDGGPALYATTAILVAGHILAAMVGSATAARHFAGTRVTPLYRLLLAALLAGSAVASLWILAQPLIGIGSAGGVGSPG